ncbi:MULTISPECIES: dihydroxyacetone kinase family protein [unclassified Rothia (in: high G+C Gram-positive bacteria)]|uniref:dihydroxyacetone kinase family protein n=1 Tax=unclassified Rothia (in: high G+C Gram-positive bacteria) TaxID=2689056 RepID=UPI0019594D48|nr:MULTISPECIES: dihydroxyacetone kinase family protein [unclassified Rothia (in: high G+C Gram-positive bacteria)]MBM7051568.1 dihydroxyacetone kinase family protein [Rothia sp. ZJ1223]QRZ61840.1 dihydroxyacetone kinase family protein [Rothia sp. ZJ932]
MTKLYNDPAEFADDQLEGFLDLYSDRLVGVPGGVISLPPKEPQVAVIVGGGSGHYPAFAGLVGPGFASGAVVGNIFTSPSAAHVYSVAKAADQGKGVILTFGNYQGDNINFGIAAKMLNAEGIDTRIVVVKDDIASAPEFDKRRGIAGDFTVFKAMGAAAAAGKSIDEVERIGNLANENTRTLGVAFSGCTMPGADQPLFTVAEGQMGVGLGIHGEPGIRDEACASAKELATMLVDAVLADAPQGAGKRIGVIVNGLGVTKYEELFLLYRTIAPHLRAVGYEIIDPEVGELVTSLDMGGVSLTVFWLDGELEETWTAPAYACAYRKDAKQLESIEKTYTAKSATVDAESIIEASPAAAAIAAKVREAALSVANLMKEQEHYLGEIDAVAGDGDHGRGMVRGAEAALEAIQNAPDSAGPSQLLKLGGRAWAMLAGGTSGVLWGASLEAAANTLADDAESFTRDQAAAAVQAFADSMVTLGGAQIGDKTLLDSLLPFTEALRDSEANLPDAWAEAANLAIQKAEETSALSPKKGRARPLAEKSIGNPDPGAISMAMILTHVGTYFRS